MTYLLIAVEIVKYNCPEFQDFITDGRKWKSEICEAWLKHCQLKHKLSSAARSAKFCFKSYCFIKVKVTIISFASSLIHYFVQFESDL